MVHVVLPAGVDDPAVPSGGNVYDRRVCRGLAAGGRTVREITVAGAWPHADAAARARLGSALAGLPDGAAVLADGLVVCGAPEVVVPHAMRLRLAVLVHLPLADETGLAPETAKALDIAERETLRAVCAVVTTSPHAARRLVRHYGLPPARVHVAPPGVDSAPLAPGTDGASALLCPAALIPRKGQDLLVAALGELTALPWTCVCAGPPRDLAHVAHLRRRISALGLTDRVRLAGALTGDRLAAAYAAADLVVLPSRAETYGMVVTEALARGVPVLATAAGAVPETLGRAPDGAIPGMLVPPDDVAALADALRRWLTDAALRDRLRSAARTRRAALPGWDMTVRHITNVLEHLR